MDHLQELFDKRLERIQALQDFIVLFGKRKEIMPDLMELRTQNYENVSLLEEVREAHMRMREVLLPRARKMLAHNDKIEQSMLNLIEAIDDIEEKEKSEASKENAPVPVNQTPLVNGLKLTAKSPRMLLSDYKSSPFVRRMKPTALQFIDFERTISSEDFAKIPQYMKGRETLDELRHFFESIIIKCFTTKYTLMHKHREVVRNQHDLMLWKHYHQQADYFPNRMFITQGDISNVTNRMVDKKTANRISMLRHIQLLQEQRHQSTICYIWLG